MYSEVQYGLPYGLGEVDGPFDTIQEAEKMLRAGYRHKDKNGKDYYIVKRTITYSDWEEVG